jgi:hypothetical protein
MPIRPREAQALAYYKSADGIGILAPRGWHCEGVSGSGGYALYLSPKPIHHDAGGWKGLDGPAIEVNHITSGASGRYEIAEIMARVFPAYRQSGRKLLREMDLTAPSGPFPKDTLVYRGKKMLEYTTPAHTEGLGNFHSWLGKNGLPIRGAAVIVGGEDGPDVVLLSVRVPSSLTSVVPVIVGEFQRETNRSSRLPH